MPFQIIRNDITKVRADAIVNTANPNPVYADGTDPAIYRTAGTDQLLAERVKIGRIEPGEAAVTPAFNLKARFIIHTAGPVWQDGNHQEYAQLASCYRKSLLLARQLGCRSIAFPLISAGVYGFPKDKALDIALKEISDFLEDTEMDVTLVVFDRKSFDLSASLVEDVRQYIDEHLVGPQGSREYYKDSCLMDASAFYVPEEDALVSGPEPQASAPLPAYSADISGPEPQTSAPLPAYSADISGPEPQTSARVSAPKKKVSRRKKDADAFAYSAGDYEADMAAPSYSTAGYAQRSLEDVMSHVGESFQECLLRLIDERGFTDAQVYKRANIDRKLFSKIRCKADYTPSRKTAISLAVALELNLDEMTDLLRKAGIALSPGSKFDLIIRYCVENRIYDTMRINALLFDYDQPLLGA